MKNSRFPTHSTSILLLALFLIGHGQVRGNEVEKEVSKIRALYNDIEGASLQKRTISFESQDDPVAGTLTQYFRNGEIVKANLDYGFGDHGGASEAYYYQNGKPFFVFVTDSMWQFSGRTLPSGESETIDTITEYRLYLRGSDMIRFLRKEAKSTNYDALKGLLGKTANGNHDDWLKAGEFVKRANQALKAANAGDVEWILVGEG